MPAHDVARIAASRGTTMTEVTVTARVTGDFPGSPVELQYRFTLEAALIGRLEITA